MTPPWLSPPDCCQCCKVFLPEGFSIRISREAIETGVNQLNIRNLRNEERIASPAEVLASIHSTLAVDIKMFGTRARLIIDDTGLVRLAVYNLSNPTTFGGSCTDATNVYSGAGWVREQGSCE